VAEPVNDNYISTSESSCRRAPSFFGTHNWQPMSFNPEVGLVYIPFMQAGARYTKSGHPKAQEINFGGLTLALALVVYMSACFYCHGSNLHSVGVAPDLRESTVPLAIAGFRTVLKDGALMQNGMPRFDKLSDEEIQQTYMYIRRGAREALGKRKASKESDVGTQ
jgi:mono/diheme cytochrome c family protein